MEGKNRLDGEDKNYDGETIRVDMNYGIALTETGGMQILPQSFFPETIHFVQGIHGEKAMVVQELKDLILW